jgi:hypothetical protein
MKHNVIHAESELEREKTVRFFRESMSNRLNDDRLRRPIPAIA